MKIRLSDLFFKPYLFLYLKKHKTQLKKIEEYKQPIKTFLVISNTALGDVILSTPAIKSLKKSFPEAKIIALIHKNYIPLFKDFEYIDTYIPFYGGYKKFFKTISEIKKYKPEMAMIFHGNGPQDIPLAIYSGCQFILKHTNNSPFKKYLSYNFKKEDKHIIEERVDLVRKIGGKIIDLRMEVGKLTNDSLIDKYKVYQGYVGFQVGASEPYRMWPLKSFILFARKLLEHHEKILITGVKEEEVYASKITSEIKNIKSVCGKTSVEELPYLINNLKFLLTSDTGTLHLAIALGTPTISLFSPSNPNYTGPYQDDHIHVVIKKRGEYVNYKSKKQRSAEAMALISEDDVYNAYKNLFDKGIK